MCTALSFQTEDHYFGRNLDLEYAYRETVTITPRYVPFSFRHVPPMSRHYALIGIAHVVDHVPLYYDATNETGLSMAGLNFPGNAYYYTPMAGKDNLASFELIPWILGKCANLDEVKIALQNLNLVQEDFNIDLPCAPLHWIIADKTGALTVESTKTGLQIYDNPVGILTNNPTFDYQMFQLNNYLGLTNLQPVNLFCPSLPLQPYSQGMGGMGLPGDLSSASRFVRAVFTKFHSVCGPTESESISQFFHILGAVAQQRGCAQVGKGLYETTRYSACCNTDKGIYYYKTYENSQISGVDLHKVDLNDDQLITYPLIQGQQIQMQN